MNTCKEKGIVINFLHMLSKNRLNEFKNGGNPLVATVSRGCFLI